MRLVSSRDRSSSQSAISSWHNKSVSFICNLEWLYLHSILIANYGIAKGQKDGVKSKMG